MTTQVIVVGHKNPDNDSVSSAVAYAQLKNELERRGRAACGEEPAFEYTPAALGPLPQESAWVLAENGFDAPEQIDHIYLRACDIMTPAPITVKYDASIIEAGKLLFIHKVRSLVVNNEDGTFMGLFSRRALSQLFVEATGVLEDAGLEAVCQKLNAVPDMTIEGLVTRDIPQVSPEDAVSAFEYDVKHSELREVVVVDGTGAALGIITRSDLINPRARKVCLVDHNERAQAVDGIDEAQVVEIIDHHRIADITTAAPIRFMNMPWGSTATIIAREYKNEGVEINKQTAAVLLSAILTDTVIMKSPTTTDIDRECVRELSEIAGVEPTEFGIELFRKRAGDEEVPVEKLVGADAKEFRIGEDTVLIAQYETVDLKSVLDREAEIREYMDKLIADKGYNFVLLMATDIIAEGSQLLCQGDRAFINRAFDINCTGEGGTWMPGVLSRKKQVAAKILS